MQDEPRGLPALRATLRARLPDWLARSAEDYAAFAAQPAPDDARGFAAHHGAAKAALAHLEMLVRLVRWAEAEPGTDSQPEDLDRLLAEARAAIAAIDPDDPEEPP